MDGPELLTVSSTTSSQSFGSELLRTGCILGKTRLYSLLLAKNSLCFSLGSVGQNISLQRQDECVIWIFVVVVVNALIDVVD